MRTAGSIFCVHDLDIVPVLESRLNIPVTVENDARCAAVAEMDRGSLKGCADAAVIIIGTALVGTIFCGGRMLRGKDLFAGEFSYMLSDADDARNPKKLLAEICKCYPHAIPVPEVTVCQYYNDSNLIGALCVYLNRRK